MGLSAGQARLLTISGRKSSSEFLCMTYSHQKIAISRELDDLLDKYQNALKQTKLVYDYYGTGDDTTVLSYNILMTPSALNDYKPRFLVNSENNIVLDSSYAFAARQAGVPYQGLGCLPSEGMRNLFIQALSSAGLIPEGKASNLLQTRYNQSLGMGDGYEEDSVMISSATGTLTTDVLQDEQFYDTLFNMICTNGWTENSNINDSSYLQQMLQNSMMFISKPYGKNSYLQENYGADPYVKEVSDEKLVAEAQEKYNREKEKLNAKEETLDLKMRNLETEISALTTEYDTVKNTISKNIESCFKRYTA